MVGSGAILNFTSNTPFGTAANKVVFSTATPTLTAGLMQRAVINGDTSGVEYATYSGGSINPFSGYSAAANINLAAPRIPTS